MVLRRIMYFLRVGEWGEYRIIMGPRAVVVELSYYYTSYHTTWQIVYHSHHYGGKDVLVSEILWLVRQGGSQGTQRQPVRHV